MNPEGRVEPLPAGNIEREMRDRESMLWSEVALKLAGGLPLTLAFQFALAIVFTLLGWVNDWPFSRFWLWFLFFAVIYGVFAWKVLPRKPSEGTFAATMLKLVSIQPESTEEQLTLDDLTAQEPKTALRVVFAPLLKGPRLVLDAIELIQARRTFTPADQARALEAIGELSTYPTGVPWTKLRRESESVNDLLHILGFLKLTDWIGVGKEGKVWILSDARKAASR